MRVFYSARERERLAQDDSLAGQLSLAWALRQAEPTRARSLLGAAQVLAAGAPQEAQVQPWTHLIQADRAACAEEFDEALDQASAARTLFLALEQPLDAALCGWIEAQTAWARGEEGRVEDLLRQLAQTFEALGDLEQAQGAWLELAMRGMSRDMPRSLALLARVPEGASEPLNAMRHLVQAQGAAHAGDYLPAAQDFLKAFDGALSCGMRYRAVALCALVAHCYSALGDLGGAAEWAQRGLDLAEPSWRLRICTCQFELGEALARQQQTQAARTVFEDLVQRLAERPLSRVMHQARHRLAQVELSQGLPAPARAHFEALLLSARQARFVDMEAEAHSGLSACALACGQAALARQQLDLGLQIARRHGFGLQEQALLLQAARIELQEGQLPAALHHLQAAQALLKPLASAEEPVALLRCLAEVHEQLGDLAQALHFERRAQAREVAELASGCERRLQIHQTQAELLHMRQENERLSQLSQTAAERAAAAEHNLRSLEHLAQIGRGLTASLQPDALFELLERELRGLVPADMLMLFQLRQGRLALLRGHEGPQRLLLPTISLDDPASLAARCAREDRLLCLDGVQERSRIPGTEPTRSLLFAPLRWEGRVVGVLSLQAHVAKAYGESEQQLVLNLAAYLAIALENSRAYEQVAALQHELAERRRQAALGSLVAGVAHELNTPLGNSLLALSAMQSQVADLQAQLQQTTPRRAALLASCASLDDGMELMDRALQRAAKLVQDFKGLAAEPDQEAVVAVDLAQLCAALLHSQVEHLARHGLRAELLLDAAPSLPTRRHALLEVLQTLLDNVLVHAKARQLSISGHATASHYELAWRDDGQGIPTHELGRVFDPFFTTRLGQGGSGLGLSVALHRTRTLLGGELRVHSPPGAGCCFTLSLPLQGPL